MLATDGLQSFVMFLYADGLIQWTTGDASDGVNGTGGTPAQVGFNAGNGINYAAVPESRTVEIIDIDTTSNIGIPGVWAFQVNEETITVSSGKQQLCKNICTGICRCVCIKVTNNFHLQYSMHIFGCAVSRRRTNTTKLFYSMHMSTTTISVSTTNVFCRWTNLLCCW